MHLSEFPWSSVLTAVAPFCVPVHGQSTNSMLHSIHSRPNWPVYADVLCTATTCILLYNIVRDDTSAQCRETGCRLMWSATINCNWHYHQAARFRPTLSLVVYSAPLNPWTLGSYTNVVLLLLLLLLLSPISSKSAQSLAWLTVIFVNENENGEKRENTEFVNEN